MDLTQEEWTRKLKQDNAALIVDVRTPEEWEEGIIPNALMIDIYDGPQFLEKIEALDRHKSYFVYCKAGGRSQQACHIMAQMGFGTTYNLLGGMTQWQGDIATVILMTVLASLGFEKALLVMWIV